MKADSNNLWNFGFVFLFFSAIVNSVAFNMTMPITPGFAVNMGASLAFAGVFTGIISIAALLARPFTSALGDRMNKKRMLIIALLTNGFVVALYAIAPNITWLIPVRILHGLSFSVNITMLIALGIYFIPQRRLGEGLSYLGVGHIIGTAFGPNLGIFIAENYTYQASFLISGIIIIFVGLAVFALPYKHSNPSQANELSKTISAKRHRIGDFFAFELLPNVFFVALLTMGMGLVNSYIVMFGNERSIYGVGLFFIVSSAVLLMSRPYMGKLIDRKGVAYAVIPGYLFTALGLILVGVSYTLWMILFAAVLIAIGNGSMPAFQVDCLRKLSSDRQTVATGTFLIGIDIGMGMGQIGGGVLTEAFGFGLVYISFGFITLAGMGLYLLYFSYQKWRVANGYGL